LRRTGTGRGGVMSTATQTRQTEARRPALERDLAMLLAATEYDRFIVQLRRLTPAQWSAQTRCPAWDVHAVACHVLGMSEFVASMPEQMRQMRAAKKAGGLFIDALTGLQVDKHHHRSPGDVLARLAEMTPKAARGRRRVPALMRRMTMKQQPVNETGSMTEPWTMGYLLDVILTRDTWMHRCDIADAVGLVMELTPDHDGLLVADIVAEWAGRHGEACSLTLTGPAGGHWSWGDGGPSYELDAVEFCCILAGRGTGEGLLATRVPF
jgi:uncharacterized protein (TIGR03083 family)